MSAAYYEFFFANPQEMPSAFHVEVLVEFPEHILHDSRDHERETALAIAHKAIYDALDYNEKAFVALSHESLCRPDEIPEMALGVPTETLESGSRVWVRIVS